MNIPAKMLYGRMEEIADLLGGDYSPELSNADLRALAVNMCQRIDNLKHQVDHLRDRLDNHAVDENAHNP